MITKYDNEIKNDIIVINIKRLINQTYKLLPSREEGLDWRTTLSTIIEDALSLLSKLEGLKTLNEDFFSFRRTIFECLNLMNKVKDYVELR